MAESGDIVKLADGDIRRIWRDAGGEFFGPHVNHGSMKEAMLLPFLRGLLAERDALAAEVERRRAMLVPDPDAYPEITDEQYAAIRAAVGEPPADLAPTEPELLASIQHDDRAKARLAEVDREIARSSAINWAALDAHIVDAAVDQLSELSTERAAIVERLKKGESQSQVARALTVTKGVVQATT